MKTPLFSIIILTYNKFEYLNDILKKVFSQTYSNIELILSDDFSEEFPMSGIQKMLEGKTENIKNVIIRKNNKNLGTVKNFNEALRVASGEYIYGMSQDDELNDENVILDLVNFFMTNNCLIATGYRDIFDEDLKKFKYRLPKADDLKQINNDPITLYKFLCKDNFISGSCTVYSKKLIEKYGYFNEDYFLYEDYPKYLSITRQGVKIFFIERVLIKYRTGGLTSPIQKKPNSNLLRDLALTIRNEILRYNMFHSNREIREFEKKIFWIKCRIAKEEPGPLRIFFFLLFNMHRLIRFFKRKFI